MFNVGALILLFHSLSYVSKAKSRVANPTQKTRHDYKQKTGVICNEFGIFDI